MNIIIMMKPELMMHITIMMVPTILKTNEHKVQMVHIKNTMLPIIIWVSLYHEGERYTATLMSLMR